MSSIPEILWEQNANGDIIPREVAVPAGYDPDISPALADVLNSGIKKASDENGSFENHTVKDLIEAENYATNRLLKNKNPFAAVKRAIGIAAGPVQ